MANNHEEHDAHPGDRLNVEAPEQEPLALRRVSKRGKEMSILAKQLRDKILAPKPRKLPPVFTSGQLGALCNIERQRLNYVIKRETGLPPGKLRGSTREFTLEETQEWVRTEKKGYVKRPSNAKAPVIISANFKGGSTKSTTAMCMAQGLTLRGRRVLVVDLDPQGTLTELCGYYADIEIKEEHTVAPFIASFIDDQPMKSMGSLIKETYWKNLDVIPASAALFGCEFNFPAIIRKHPHLKIWRLLRQGLEDLRYSYDYIICDTAPSLSYLTVNALLAADTIIMPLVPDSLDFISSMQFWSLFSDLTDMLADVEQDKAYDMIRIVLSKVDNSSGSTPIVRQWAQKAYESWLLSTEIPYSSVASAGALSFSTVFDQAKGTSEAAKRTVDRLRAPVYELVRHIDEFYVTKWQKQVQAEQAALKKTTEESER